MVVRVCRMKFDFSILYKFNQNIKYNSDSFVLVGLIYIKDYFMF